MYVHVLTDLFRCRYPRVGAEGRDAVIDVLIKVIPKNKLAVELFVKVGGTYSNSLVLVQMIPSLGGGMKLLVLSPTSPHIDISRGR